MIIGIDGNEANVKNRVGVNQYAFEILKALEKLPESRKHQFIIYLQNPLQDDFPKTRDNWKYKILSGGGLWVLRRLMPYLWFGKNRPDVFFTPSHYTPLFSPIPMVVSIMDLGYLRFPEQFRKRDFYQLKYWGAWSMKMAKKIIAISESTKNEIIENYPWAKDKTVVTYPGYDKGRYKKQKAESIKKIKDKYGICGEYILFLGTLKPSKNIEGLIEAYRLLTTDLKLVITGKKGWLYQSIFKKVRDLKLESKVVFTDFVSEEDKPYLLSGAKVFVAPSLWEGFGLNVLEAMACGTPVVVSNVGSLPEVVGNAGIIIDPMDIQGIAEAMKKVVSLPKNKYNELSKKSIQQAQKFDWVEAGKKTLEILERTANV